MSALQTTRCVLLSYLHLFSLAAVCLHLPRECIIKTMWLHNQGLGMFKNSNTGSTDLNRIPTRYQMQTWRPLKTNENRLPTAYAKKKVFWHPRSLPEYVACWICKVEFPQLARIKGFYIAFLSWLHGPNIHNRKSHNIIVCSAWCPVNRGHFFAANRRTAPGK